MLDRRSGDNAIAHLKKQNAATDRRHDRRPLQEEEFSRLLDAAATGPNVEGLPGTDRVMLYIMAAWTGFRRAELASLTLRSLDLDADSATVRVEASDSKRRRTDEIPLHPVVVERLQEWLGTKTKTLTETDPLFVLITAKKHIRETAKMMRLDLQRARAAWIEEAGSDDEEARREQSEFLLC